MLNKINNNYILPSVHKVYYSSLWIENEIWDLFGIYFLENKYLSRILTDYGFIGFPLRKDFPLTGYLELKYQLKNKLLFYTKVELTQEYRNFFNIYKK
jgi:NADH-quinone oxidoreductase subunit C